LAINLVIQRIIYLLAVRMNQLNLNILSRLAYAPDSFLFHAGVADLYESVFALLTEDDFGLCFVQGAPRKGKTHLSICLSDTLAKHNLFPRIVEGEKFADWMTKHSDNNIPASDQVIIVDDADKYFASAIPGNSGPFVSFIEGLRAAKCKVVFLCKAFLDDLPCDDHIMSRLRAGSNFSLNDPVESEIQELILVMARQRGIHLTARKVQYLNKRIGRDIPAIEEYLDKVHHLANVIGKPVHLPLLSDSL